MSTHNPDSSNENERAIQLVKTITDNKNVQTAVQAILSAIPYAGGPLSTVLSEFRTRRAFDKMYNTLNSLKDAIESKHTEISEILKQDEVVELVHKTLREVADTADDKKVEYLNNALIKAFTTGEIEYSQKQHYLEVLRNLTTGEIKLLRELYLSYDPFEETLQSGNTNIDIGNTSSSRGYFDVASFDASTILSPPYEDHSSGDTLYDKLHSRIKLSKGAIEGLIHSLDSKGLTNITPNLNSRVTKKRNPYRINSMTSIASLTLGPKQTPYEASRTVFGQDFVNYITSKYYGS